VPILILLLGVVPTLHQSARSSIVMNAGEAFHFRNRLSWNFYWGRAVLIDGHNFFRVGGSFCL
jgi:hypothetical protein